MMDLKKIVFPSSSNPTRARALGLMISIQIFTILTILSVASVLLVSVLLLITGINIEMNAIIVTVLVVTMLIIATIIAVITYQVISRVNVKGFFMELVGNEIKAHAPGGLVEFTQDNIESIEPLIRFWAREFKENLPEGLAYSSKVSKKGINTASTSANRKDLWVITLKEVPKISGGTLGLRALSMSPEVKKRVIVDVPSSQYLLEKEEDEFWKRAHNSRNLPQFTLPDLPKPMPKMIWHQRTLFPDGRTPLPDPPRNHKDILNPV